MFSTVRNIQQLTSLVLKWGVKEAVLCPGSRNAAIVHNLNAAGLQCYNITDERSAGFFAIGLMEANGGHPVLVCVTSGSAVLNLAPAVSEAYYRNLPLLVITADRPQQWIGQMDGQTLPQTGAFGKMVEKCVSLPEPIDEEGKWYCNRLINESMITLYKTKRPVHINVPITEPMFDFSAPSLPEERVIKLRSGCSSSFKIEEQMIDIWHSAKSRLVIVGQMSPEEMAICAPMLKELTAHGCVVVAENLSNIHTATKSLTSPDEMGVFHIGNFDEMLATDAFISPDLVLTCGGHIVSKRLKQHLRQHQPHWHWHVSPLGEVADLFMCCTDVIEATSHTFLNALSSTLSTSSDLSASSSSSYYEKMTHLSLATRKKPITNNWGDLTALQQVLNHTNDEWSIQVANSTMVRNLQKIFNGINPVYCNRGVNGIEGSVSAAVGYWVGSRKPTLLLVGDLSFFYDQNGLWNNYVKQPNTPLRILVINNSCGDIFHHLPALNSPYLDSSIAAAHTTSAEGIAKECGAQYLCASTQQELESHLEEFFRPTPSVCILEVR